MGAVRDLPVVVDNSLHRVARILDGVPEVGHHGNALDVLHRETQAAGVHPGAEDTLHLSQSPLDRGRIGRRGQAGEAEHDP